MEFPTGIAQCDMLFFYHWSDLNRKEIKKKKIILPQITGAGVWVYIKCKGGIKSRSLCVYLHGILNKGFNIDKRIYLHC